MMNPETVERTLEFTGADSLDDLFAWFGHMSQEEIEESLNECFPQDRNEELAGNVYCACANYEYLKENWPQYFC